MPWTSDRIEQVRQLIGSEYHTARSAALVMGVTRNAIIGVCARNHIPMANGKKGCTREGRAQRRVKTARISIEKGAPDPVKANQAPPYPEPTEAPSEALRCKFPIGNPKGPDFHFCPNRKVAGPYCVEHYRLCASDKESADRVLAETRG